VTVAPVWIAVVALYALAGLVSPAMLQAGQVLNILQVASFLGLVAAGQTLTLLVAGIDLSQAGTVTLTNIVATAVMDGAPSRILPAVLLCLGLAALIGTANGLLVAGLGVTPLVATLATNGVLFGAALLYTGGAPHGAAAPGFTALGQGSLAGVPAPTLIWLGLALLLAFLTRRTVWGRRLYAVGANPLAARLTGMPVRLVQLSAYLGSAVLACLGGLLLTAYIGSPSLGIGDQFLLTSVAAVVVGGTALTGGVGGVIGTVGGAVFITELGSFTNIVQVSSGTQQVLQGAIIALSVLAYRLVGNRSARAA
jgi:ribose/xylose/arabinose/galactoside ABC-type transport system permease subunit